MRSKLVGKFDIFGYVKLAVVNVHVFCKHLHTSTIRIVRYFVLTFSDIFHLMLFFVLLCSPAYLCAFVSAREYADMVRQRIETLGLKVDMAQLSPTVNLAEALDNAARRGLLYTIIVTPQHESHRSVTLTILHGRNPQGGWLENKGAGSFLALQFSEGRAFFDAVFPNSFCINVIFFPFW